MESNNKMLALVGIFFYGLIICFIFGSAEIYTYFAPDLVVNLSKEEAKSFCGDSSLAGKYGLFIDKGSYLKRQKNLNLRCGFFDSKKIVGFPAFIKKATLMSKAYDILSSFYGIVSPEGIDWSMSEVITKKFTLTRGGLINTVQYLKNGIPLMEVDNNHSAQKVNDCQWRELKSFINPSNTSSVYLPFGLVKAHGYFFISTDGINKFKIDKRTFAKQLDDNVTCIINKYNAENVSSWR